MNKPKFVYVTYIASTPERVWNALREGELTRQYWGHENVSDWKPGSPWRHVLNDGKRTARIVGEVLESVPQRRLVLSWAEPAEAADPNKHSRVAIDIEKISDMVRLTVTHDELEPGSDMLGKIANGWPRVLSSLKSFLETGKALDTWAA
jgi:uncharacterized protein YndB with AHSA1/START domain